MSYCVNCGVELDRSATKCVLCNTPIPNTENHPDKPVPTPFSEEAMVPKKIKERFLALIITFIILIPNIVCALVNLFFSPEKLWFVFLASSSFLFWVVFILPFLMNQKQPHLLWAIDTVAVALYGLVFHIRGIGESNWYFKIALPVIGIASLCVLCYICWARKSKHHKASKALHIFIDIVLVLSVLCLCLFISNYIVKAQMVLIADACCFALVLFWLYVCKSKKTRAYLSRKLFV